jgi:hypothetical protein
MSLYMLGEPHVAKRDHDGEKRLHHHVVQVMYEGELKCPRSVGKYWPCGVSHFQVFDDSVGGGEDYRWLGWSLRHRYRRECVYGPSISPNR